jgi:GDP/UDP-N,N'-diacetylbacillosamine 2-epimerase (hydrolysing)
LTRHIVYISGTRADFGLMRSTLWALDAAEDVRLSIVATGMHLDPAYGQTVNEIGAAGLTLAQTVNVSGGEPSGATMARDIGLMIGGFVDALTALSPDLVLLLGDRGEMLAGAIAAAHLNIPVAHVAGGDRSGTIDEPVRHAISKLSHIHLVTTEQSGERLVRMGERADCVHVVGAPSLDELLSRPVPDEEATRAAIGLHGNDPYLMLVFHPVLQDAARAGDDCRTIIDAILQSGLSAVALAPNSDAGSAAVRQELEATAAASGRFLLKTHLPRDLYVAALAHSAALVGNSSSGIVEAACFGVPVINIGPRQNFRERNANIIDVDFDANAISAAIRHGLQIGRFPIANIYGDGHSGPRIAQLLRTIELSPSLLHKVNSY